MTATLKLRVFNRLVHAASVLTFITGCCLAWSVLFEKPYLSYTNLPFPSAMAARAGEPVELLVQRCSSARSPRSYMTTHTLNNVDTGAVMLLPVVWIDVAPGCTSSYSRINVIPKTTAPGIYTVSGMAMVDGMVLTHKVPWASRPFEVLPAKEAKEK